MSARLTPEEATQCDQWALRRFMDAKFEEVWPEECRASFRILDLLDENAALRARAEQDERDRAVLAAEVKAWRRFDNQCSVRDQIVYTADSRPTHPADTMKATDSSGALTRATPAEGGDA